MPINNSDDLIKSFNLSDRYKITKDSAELTFLAQREYPKNIRYSPPITKQGDPDTVAHFQVIYNETNADKAKNKKPITIIVSNLSKYLYKVKGNKRHQYNYNDEDCPTRESLQKSKASIRPIELESEGEYFYNEKIFRIEDKSGNQINGEKLLDTLFNKHIKNTYLIRGLPIRFKLSLKWKLVWLCDKIINFLKHILRNAFDIELVSKEFSAGILMKYKREDLKRKKAEMLIPPKVNQKERINLFGYPTSKHVVITFCFFVIIAYLKGLKEYIKLIGSNILLVISVTILSLWVLENIISEILLLHLINWLIGVKFKLVFWNFQV